MSNAPKCDNQAQAHQEWWRRQQVGRRDHPREPRRTTSPRPISMPRCPTGQELRGSRQRRPAATSERTRPHSGPERGETEPPANRKRPGSLSLNLDRDNGLHPVEQGADDRQHAEPRRLFSIQSLRGHHAGEDQSPGTNPRKPDRSHPRNEKTKKDDCYQQRDGDGGIQGMERPVGAHDPKLPQARATSPP